ncbi:MAG TPA: hypothetical protein VFU38_03480 [Candidatus Krumholzibacteria bacterium]|nr:hypothetical protein [Candidatus Krumholzibacteria bacterium]
MSKKWMGLCSMAVVFMLIAAGGCSKKNETAENEQVEEVDTTPAETPTTPSAAGTYAAQTPAGQTPGASVMLTLNTDNTASMSTDLMNGEPAKVESGTWATNAMNGVDVTVQRDVAGQMLSATMSFAMVGDTLMLNNATEAGFVSGLKLVKTGGAPAGESHEGHSH